MVPENSGLADIFHVEAGQLRANPVLPRGKHVGFCGFTLWYGLHQFLSGLEELDLYSGRKGMGMCLLSICSRSTSFSCHSWRVYYCTKRAQLRT